MAAPPKPWKAEYAKSGRSSCKICKNPINKEGLRLGKMVQATQFDGFMPMWNHGNCVLKKAKQIKLMDDVEGIDSLRWEDQQKIRTYVEGGGTGSGAGTTDEKGAKTMEYGIEVSQTSRAACRHCKLKIMKGQVRISSKPDEPRAKGLAWHHANCLIDLYPSVQVDKMPGWESLPPPDQEAVRALVKVVPSTTKIVEEKEAASKVGARRKRDVSGDQKSKIAKVEGDVSASRVASADDLDSKLEAQSKELWSLKDDLKKHVTTVELRQMLEANGQDTSGSELDLRDRCADGMMFGALGLCSLCSGFLRYSGGTYKCTGFLSEWSKCSFSTREPERLKGKWKVPEDTDNEYLSKWFKSQKIKKPVRTLPSPSSNNPSGSQASNSKSPFSDSESLGDLKVVISGLPKESVEEWKGKIEEAGGQVHAKIKKDTNCYIAGGVLDHEDAEIRKARRMKLPVVKEDYLVECFKKHKKLPFGLYKVESIGETSSMVTVKVKGRSAVHKASGMQDTGHILEDGKSIYNTTLNMSDLSTGVNSCYILQIIQDDKGSNCHVFRKWGRVGNDKIGGNKLDRMSKSEAVTEFKRLFLEKTGNSWEAWEQKQNFQKRPGKFFPLEIDYGVNKQLTKQPRKNVNSQLARPLVELLKMLFNVEAYRAAMMEFEINMSEMPLGKLSKSNIQKGFEALTEIQNLLNSSSHDPSIKETLIIDASNRFFTVIPSIHPHVIRDEYDFKSKVKMLEALQDIEIASRLVGFDADNDDSLDDKYRKLNCDVTPLSHDSDDYRLIEKYLHNTHAPTHTDWSLELEEVFSLEREGELNKFDPYRRKLKNRMLLWHGSRLTNYVGILNQGLRIAPPEAPATGYMFGKGVYFADLVSKSAQYCFTDKKTPVGLMLLSEVALGEVYELKNATYMDKPPEGKHSTKGLGKKVPQESEFVKWRDEVTVPCGKPVASKVRASELMYNEYIVYNTAQVKMQFLVKVRFHHKK
ncbi:poly [ADP-ribose] polymerase 1 [Mercurialis annua]|uniref:poly [ADP-ribose] polymerase 1 n=1 Tax=Mercurialis annua TaxID=3986 RepID=UPI00215E3890|nr:poly [ADP-ribose] polymerase 1 [Mercurialis annua]